MTDNDIRIYGPNQAMGELSIDSVRDVCPSSWKSAVIEAYGIEAQNQIETAQTDLLRRQEEREKKFATSRKENEAREQANKAWANEAIALGSRRDDELITRVKTAIDAFEAQMQSSSPERRIDMLERSVKPDMLALAKSGYASARSISKGEAGRRQFLDWDKRIGGHVLKLNLRIQKISSYTFGMVQPFPVILSDYIEIYRQQLAERSIFEDKYFSVIKAGMERYRIEKSNEPPPTTTYLVTYRVVTLRPRQSVMYAVVDEGARKAVEFMAMRNRNKQEMEEVDRNVKRTRHAFWSCYTARCADGGPLWLEYSRMLAVKDSILIGQTVNTAIIASANIPNPELTNDVVGVGKIIDDGPVAGCEYFYDRLQGEVTDLTIRFMNTLNAAELKRKRDEIFYGDEHLKLQQCRDAMEFALRPS